MSFSNASSRLTLEGGVPLRGRVRVQGSKNEVLKLMAASLLASDAVTLENVPAISDVASMVDVLRGLGGRVKTDGHRLTIDPAGVTGDRQPPAEAVRRFRASFVVVGPLLARFGRVRIAPPGGDLIGPRPLTTHLRAFAELGVKVHQSSDGFTFEGRVSGSRTVVLQEMSVTATENVLLASVLSDAQVTIDVAAAEPEVQDLCRCLAAMGAQIGGIGTHRLVVRGVRRLSGLTWTVIPDRIDAVTFAIAAAVTRGDVTLEGVDATHLALVLAKLRDVGVAVSPVDGEPQSVRVVGAPTYRPATLDTRPYPGFPSDLQAPMSVLCTQASGESRIFETLYEGRFGYVEDLRRMGADVEVVDRHTLVVRGPTALSGRAIRSVDIRAGATLILAALAAKGESVIGSVEHVDRGYERIEERLRSLGARIERSTV